MWSSKDTRSLGGTARTGDAAGCSGVIVTPRTSTPAGACAKLSVTPDVRRIASRVVWWDTLEHAVSCLDDFLARVMSPAGPLPARRFT